MLNKSSFLKLAKFNVPGQGRYAHVMNLFDDINLEDVSPKCVIALILRLVLEDRPMQAGQLTRPTF